MSPGGASNRAEVPRDAPRPEQAGSPEEFTKALRALRIWSGLTYRQLEGKSAASGAVMPSSTIATALTRNTLPRASFVAAFTRACGLGEADVERWLDARRRLALGERAPLPHDGDPPGRTDQDDAAEPVEGRRAPGPGRLRQPVLLLTAALIGAGATLGVLAVLPDAGGPHRPAVTAQPVRGLAVPAVGSWAQINPARTPHLCLTEGRDRTHRYATAVAAQLPCTTAARPRTYIEPLGDDVVQLQWHHPKYGIGCLTLLRDGPGRDLFEPRDDCADDDPAQQFRVEPVGPPGAARFRLRSAATGQCLSLRDQDTEEGAEVVQGRCSGARDQEFLIALVPPP
ncbi:XRE family transcriptional regulator [Streptomyces sp. Tu 6176]|uniref:XRE family transcriptional regulator n=1 Tax=Streptomyces sp. Tu 6176 TaxID=1470557 RepID=UPI000686DB1B|nr:XRE family transcriptional regulator [Streptomyces sp. Tu 6176]